jgi:uroporphyrinogen decarboxylase
VLESHRREIVVVFCDLRGYTAFTETAEPEEVLEFLREYHGALGPLVSQRIEDHTGIARLDASSAMSKLEPILETVRRVQAALGPQTALIGFAGSPWTVAAYMVEGGTSKDFRRVKSWAYRDENGFDALIELLVESTIAYLGSQIAAGADVVQLFDSWAGVLPEYAFGHWVIDPTRRVVAPLKRLSPIARSSVFRVCPVCCTNITLRRPASMPSASIQRSRLDMPEKSFSL